MKNPNILIVDDDSAVLSSLKRELRKEPFIIHSAPHAAGAIAYLESNHPSMILSDHKMPERDGISLLNEVRERWPDIVRVLISGYADMDILIGAINKAEIFRFIPKPWEKELLIEIIHESVEKYSHITENGIIV